MEKKSISNKYLLIFLFFIFINCKKEEENKISFKKEKIMPFVEVPPIKDVTFHKDTIREYEYRTGTSGDYQYNYDVFGVDEEGNEVLGNITVDGKYGNGIIINKNSKKINVDVEWVGHGKLKGIDSNSNEYQLEVNED